MDDDPPIRQNPSPGAHIHWGQSNIFFLTVTAHKRKQWLANAIAHKLLHETWSNATAWLMGDYLIMPDHIHAFCAPRDLNFTIEAWIAYWKREFALQHKNKDWKFQSRGWHHRIRNGENHSDKWRYMQENPVRKGLVKNSEGWRFKGRVFDLMWTGR